MLIGKGMLPPSVCKMAELNQHNSQRPSMFAVVIGINKYKDRAVLDLNGAVADAEAVLQYLIEVLGVERDRIVYLRDEEATRDAVIHAIQNLATNPEISAEDPILIYYAGHGSEALLSSEHSFFSSGLIQMLVPYDFVMNGSLSCDGQGVFDVTLSNILSEIARQKSDNIVSQVESRLWTKRF